jgi:hypothetical protein
VFQNLKVEHVITISLLFLPRHFVAIRDPWYYHWRFWITYIFSNPVNSKRHYIIQKAEFFLHSCRKFREAYFLHSWHRNKTISKKYTYCNHKVNWISAWFAVKFLYVTLNLCQSLHKTISRVNFFPPNLSLLFYLPLLLTQTNKQTNKQTRPEFVLHPKTLNIPAEYPVP